ncbi:hypothetical protein QZH41_008385, partial [Actinostola sp. cb2023]
FGAQILQLRQDLETLKAQSTAVSVEASLAQVRQLASAPTRFRDPSAILAAIQKLADDARTTGHEKAAEYDEAILRQSRPLLYNTQFGDIIIRLIGSKEESRIATTIAKMTKASPATAASSFMHPYPRPQRGRGGFDPPAKRQKLDFVQLAQQPVKTSEIKWCNSQGEPIDTVGPGPDPTVVSQAKVLASPRATFFRDPAHFIPGELHRQADRWKFIPNADPEIISLVLNKVDAWNFIVHFKGRFGNQAYDAPYPPHKIFPNNQSCLEFEEFITNTILERLANGSLSFWGLVGDVEPPHLVMPITVEPTKPRMCHDERFLNLWIKFGNHVGRNNFVPQTPTGSPTYVFPAFLKEAIRTHISGSLRAFQDPEGPGDLPFTLDYLSDIPRYVEANHFQTVCDDKSGYDHVSLTRNCQTLFGLSWKGCYFCYRTLPFGWKASAYIYHSIGLIATSHIRSLGVPCSQYIDDRHIGQLITSPACQWSNYEKAEAACYIATTTLTSLGYTLALSKSSLAPNQVVKFLGYLCDSRRCAFILPEVKKEKFRALREKILSHEEIDVKSLQRFAGKTTSFSIAVPAARLYTRTCYPAIGISSKTPTRPVKVMGELWKEILHWRFLDAWKGHLPWFEERHRVVRSFTDASNSGWGAKLSLEPGSSQYLRDYWCDEDRPKPIVIREALALRNALAAMGESLQHSRVDGHVDSLPLVQSWKNQGGKSKDLTAVIRSIYEIALRFNIALSLWYVPSSENLADPPSRVLSANDCMLAATAWNQIEARWGPHTLDLMALDSNAQRECDGHPLPHYTPWPTESSAGINVFAQSIPPEHNVYVFPPLGVNGPNFTFPRPFNPQDDHYCTACSAMPFLVANGVKTGLRLSSPWRK